MLRHSHSAFGPSGSSGKVLGTITKRNVAFFSHFVSGKRWMRVMVSSAAPARRGSITVRVSHLVHVREDFFEKWYCGVSKLRNLRRRRAE